MLEQFQATYHAIDLIDDNSVWQTYIYRLVEMEDVHTVLDCSFLCKNVDRNHACDLFAFVDHICYIGKSGHSGGNVEENLNNVTIYMTEGTNSISQI